MHIMIFRICLYLVEQAVLALPLCYATVDNLTKYSNINILYLPFVEVWINSIFFSAIQEQKYCDYYVLLVTYERKH